MLDRLTRIQLSIFAIVTVLTVSAISVFYLHAGRSRHRRLQNRREFRCRRRYLRERQRHLPRCHGRAGGVGRADERRCRRPHATQQRHPGARQRHRDGQERLGGRRAVHRPGAAGRSSSAKLRNGATIGQDRTAIGQDIAGLLDEADRLVSSLGDTRLQDLLRETFKAFNGSGPELARLIQSSRLLVDGPTTATARSRS